MFNNVLRIDATYRSKISRDRYQIQFDVNLYPLSVFANTPFKLFSGEYQWLDGWPSWIWYGRLDFTFFTFFFIKDFKLLCIKMFYSLFLKVLHFYLSKFFIYIFTMFYIFIYQCFTFLLSRFYIYIHKSFSFLFIKVFHFYLSKC